jgi:hypothetical protein
VLVSGARAYDPSTPFGFSERLAATQNLRQDTSVTSFNSVTGQIIFGRTALGVYNFVFPGFEKSSAPRVLLVTGVNQTPARCRVQNYDIPNSVLQASCSDQTGAAFDARVTVAWFTRGRVGHRFGFATPLNGTSASPPNDPLFTLNSTGGSVVARRLATGRYTVTFGGLARPLGGTEIVLVAGFKDFDHSCSLGSWGNTGASDLIVTLQCFDAAGTAIDGRFSVLVVE